MEKLKSPRHLFEFSDNKITITRIATKENFILSLCAFVFVTVPMTAISIYHLTNKNYVDSFIFLLLSLFAISAIIINCIVESKIKKNLITADDFGITDREVNITLTISWQDIVCWGYVDDNISVGKTDASCPRQTCLYFSTKVVDELSIRKRLDGIYMRFYRHNNSKDFIALGFYDTHIDSCLYNRLNEFFCIHLESDKRKDFCSACIIK